MMLAQEGATGILRCWGWLRRRGWVVQWCSGCSACLGPFAVCCPALSRQRLRTSAADGLAEQRLRCEHMLWRSHWMHGGLARRSGPRAWSEIE